ncbi:hypothetical protein BDV11DRAFT_208606 [Aspergillus similis]
MDFLRSTSNASQTPSSKLSYFEFSVESDLRVLLFNWRSEAAAFTTNESLENKYCRFYFNAETGTLIAKVMPNPAHEPAIRPFGSTTVTVGNWKREADCCWAPASTNTGLTRGWLEAYSSSVKLVVTISIKYELLGLSYADGSLLSPPSARCTAALILFPRNSTTSITGESYLDLPFDRIVDRHPHQPLERLGDT